jgi:thioredoxin-dependent peroxiredoxin
VQAYRDQYAQIAGKGAQVVGISTDDVETLKRFRDENKLPYPLLSDAGGKVAKQYGGTMAVVGFASRATFVLEQDGKVKSIVEGSDAINPAGAINACPMPKKG